jgi:hypothetical protein
MTKTVAKVRKLATVIPIVYLLLVLTIFQSQAQEPVVASWETDAPPEGGWTVGDPIPLRLRVTYPADSDVTLPELPAQWGPFEVRDQKLLEPSKNDSGHITAVREATVTLWSPGEHKTPPFAIHHREADDRLREVPVPPLAITVASVLTEDDAEKHDLKPQASLPRPPIWPWLLAAILVAMLLFLAIQRLLPRLRQRRSAGLEDVEPVDDRFPEEIAYEELERVAALDLPAQGEFKRHYTLVTDCVRNYLEGIYRIPAIDRTTGELMLALRKARLGGEMLPSLRALLEEADLVKFAKLRPSIERARDAVVQARHLVDITKPDRTATDDEIEEPVTNYALRNTQ